VRFLVKPTWRGFPHFFAIDRSPNGGRIGFDRDAGIGHEFLDAGELMGTADGR
jgi:hypothetical protein